MILDPGLRDASGARKRLVCPGDPPAHCRGLRQPRQELSRPSPPAPGSWQAGSLSPSVNSAGALASVTQGAEAQATEGSAGLEGVKPTGSARAPAVARGWVADSQAPSTGGYGGCSQGDKRVLLAVTRPGPPTQAPRGRAGGGRQEQAGCPPDACPGPLMGTAVHSGGVAWSSGFAPGEAMTLGCSPRFWARPPGPACAWPPTHGPPRCPHSNLRDL